MPERSTKPYLIRAIHEWCADSGYTPYLSVKVNENTRVPMEFVKNGEIVLNLSYDATHKLTIDNEGVKFAARFSGVSRECAVPLVAITGIFARENSQGLFFAPESEGEGEGPPAAPQSLQPASAQPQAVPPSGQPDSPPPPTRPKLQIVK